MPDEKNPIDALQRRRIVFLGSEITTDSANQLIARVLDLDYEDPTAPITLYINSPGGDVYAMFAIYDTVRQVSADIHTRCVGLAASAAAVILAAGDDRAILPNARVLIHQPSLPEGMRGQASDIAIHAAELGRVKDQIATLLAAHSHMDVDTIRSDTERDRWLDAVEAVRYGIVDRIHTAA